MFQVAKYHNYFGGLKNYEPFYESFYEYVICTVISKVTIYSVIKEIAQVSLKQQIHTDVESPLSIFHSNRLISHVTV